MGAWPSFYTGHVIMTLIRSRARFVALWNDAMKKRLLDAASVLAEIVLNGLFLAVLALPVMIVLGGAGLLSVVPGLSGRRRPKGGGLGEEGRRVDYNPLEGGCG